MALAGRSRARGGARGGGRRSWARRPTACWAACSTWTRSRRPTSPGAPSSATPSTRASARCRRASAHRPRAGSARGARGARRSGWRCAWRRARGRSTFTTPSSTWTVALVDLAERHADDLAADYTYLQPAQPTTIGHLLLAYAYPALRDAARLRACHAWLDLGVAGVGGSAGSRWPLDRARLAELLGCAGVVTQPRTRCGRRTVTWSWRRPSPPRRPTARRSARTWRSWRARSSPPCSLADRHSRASALMPQKRNPYALAVMRTQAGIAAGSWRRCCHPPHRARPARTTSTC